jgi:putative transposase
MKSLTNRGLRGLPETQIQISLPVQGVLRDVQHAFVGLCVHAGKQVLAAMMKADRASLCDPKGIPDVSRRAVSLGSPLPATRSS